LSRPVCCLHRLQGLEPLWSPVVATVGNRAQMKPPPKPRNRPKPLPWVATSCRDEPMVKEGVDGSSPSEGSLANSLSIAADSAGSVDLLPGGE
jgi:hypothetical protein